MTNTVVLPKRKRRPVDKTLPVIMTLLLMMGLVTLFSATYTMPRMAATRCPR